MSIVNLQYHIVLTAKYRRQLITPDVVVTLVRLVEQYEGCELIRWGVGGDGNHIHLLVRLSPRVALEDFVRRLKSSSSRLAAPGRPLWARGYWARTVGGGALAVKRYIENQK